MKFPPDRDHGTSHEFWVRQSKWWTKHKVGIQALQDLERQGEFLRQEQEILTLTLWLFAYSGLMPEAQAYAAERGILWSALPEFNELLDHVGLRPLPELHEQSRDG